MKEQDENSDDCTCADQCVICLLFCVRDTILLYLESILISNILCLNKICGFNLACTLLLTLKLRIFYTCRYCLFVIHVWHQRLLLLLFCFCSFFVPFLFFEWNEED